MLKTDRGFIFLFNLKKTCITLKCSSSKNRSISNSSISRIAAILISQKQNRPDNFLHKINPYLLIFWFQWRFLRNVFGLWSFYRFSGVEKSTSNPKSSILTKLMKVLSLFFHNSVPLPGQSIPKKKKNQMKALMF